MSRVVVVSVLVLSLMPLAGTSAYSATATENIPLIDVQENLEARLLSDATAMGANAFLVSLDDDDDKEKDDDDDDKEKDDDDDDKEKDDDEGRGHDNPPRASEPVAEAGSISTDEDTSAGIKLEGSDRDDDEISFSIVEEPQHGTLGALNALTGDVTYEPLRDYYGPDSFTFKVNDGASDSEPATVTIDVIAVNDPPVAHDAELRTREDVPQSFTLSASDPDNDLLTFAISSGPNHGSLTGTAPNLQYRPHIHFDGSDSIAFKVNDGTVDSNEARLVIIVKPEREERERDAFERAFPAVTVPVEPISISNSTQNATLIEEPVSEITAPITFIDTPLPIIGSLGNTAIGPANTEVAAAGLARIDILAPKLLLPTSPLAVLATSATGTQVSYSVHAVDDEDGDITPSCSPGSGSFFPVGRVNVLCKATDAAGNIALKSFIVVVRAGPTEDSGSSLLLSTIVAAGGAAAYGGFRIVKYRKLF